MGRQAVETVGLRVAGRAALDRDPQEKRVEFTCPRCGLPGVKNARREHNDYRFTDGFVQDLEGEAFTCRGCKKSLRIVPIVLVHTEDERRRFHAVFRLELTNSRN